MPEVGVHRIVEGQAAARGDRPAVTAACGPLTYRDLNQQANAVARDLMARGLRRGGRVAVKMERSPELAVVLLAVLKAGAAYICLDSGEPGWPAGLCITGGAHAGGEKPVLLDAASVLAARMRPAPNLPIVARAGDIACVLPQRNGLPGVLVPHDTMASLQSHPLPERPVWSGEPAALDLWLPLMAGVEVSVAAAPSRTAAA